MTSAQHSDNLSRAEETKRDLRAAPIRVKESLASVHASLLAKHVSYAVLIEIAEVFRRHHPSKLAKQAAYSLLYAVPSALIVLVSLAAIVDKNTGAGVSEALFTFISEQAPAELQPLLESLVQRAVVETSESEAILAALVSLGIAVWGGAAGVGALIDAINSVYGIRNTRSFIKGTALKLGLMLLGGAMVIGSFILLTFGRQLGERVAGAAGRGMTLVNVLSSGPVWALLLLSATTPALLACPGHPEVDPLGPPGHRSGDPGHSDRFRRDGSDLAVLEPWVRLRRGGERPRSALVALPVECHRHRGRDRQRRARTSLRPEAPGLAAAASRETAGAGRDRRLRVPVIDLRLPDPQPPLSSSAAGALATGAGRLRCKRLG